MGLKSTYAYDKNGRPLFIVGNTKNIFDDNGKPLESILSQISGEAAKKRFYYSSTGFPDVGDSDCCYCDGYDFYIWDTDKSKYETIISQTASSALEKAHSHSNKIILDSITKAFTEEELEKLNMAATTASTAIQSIKIGTQEYAKSGSEVTLPTYPTRSSLEIDLVDNTSDLDKPVSNATADEFKAIRSELSTETLRATTAESSLSNSISQESLRAIEAEKQTDEALQAEVTRATLAEQNITRELNSEVARAQEAETTNANNISAETTRAQGAEKTLTDNLSAEQTRANAAEKTLTDNLSTEITRAKAKESELQGNIDAHTSTVAGELQALKAADTALDEKKANTADVNQELGKRYTKDQVYTKAEVLQKIEDLIGSAPDTLDTFKEIADALGNDPNFAATIMNELSGKVDKAAGKQLTSNDYSDSEKAIVADVNAKKHTHSNKSVIDKVTQGLLDNWTAAYNHISDSVKHITAAERTNWNDADSKKHTHSNKSIIDKITQTLIDNWGAAYSHIADAVKHITATERTNWNDADSKKHTHGNKTVIDKVTQAMLDKLAGVSAGAEVNVQSDWSITDTGSDAFIKNKPSSLPAKGGAADTAERFKTARTINDVAFDGSKNITVEANNPIKVLTNESLNNIKTFGDYYAAGGNTVTNKPNGVQHFGLRVLRVASGYIGQELDVSGRKWSREFDGSSNSWSGWVEFFTEGHKPTWGDVTGKPSTFPPTSHTHTKSQVSDMPTKLSQFTNDTGFLTSTDVDTSQNHTHANKTVLDKVNQVMLDKLNGIASGAEVNVQSDWSVTDSSLDSYIKNKPTSMPASDVSAWAKASSKPSYVWDEIGSKPSSFPPSSHTHDDRYYTESEINTKFQNLNPAYIADGYTSKAFYLNTHPENAGVIIPFINNDLAFLLKRGGSAKVTYDGVEKAVDISAVFDGSPSYWSINPTGVTEIIIELTLHQVFTWTNTIYIDFGSANWRAKNINIDVMNTIAGESAWTNKATLTNYSIGHYKIRMSHNSGTGFNKIRFTFSSWNNSTGFRLSALGVLSYGSFGLREVFIPRDGGVLYGPLSPYANNAYDLGSSSKMWRNIYGNLIGNATSAAKLSTVRSINGTNFDGSSNITTAKWGTARNLKIGNATKTVDGSADISFTASEIGLKAEIVLKNISVPVSSFENLVAKYVNSGIKADQIPDVVFDKPSQTVAAKAGITVSTETGNLLLTALRLPESDLTIESLILKDAS